MYKKIIKILVFVNILAASVLADSGAKITRAKGEVKVRYGMDETWESASVGLILKEIDTILTGEGAEVTLQMPDGTAFTLGRNSILDIGDLRKILKKELFLYLMSHKIQKIKQGPQKTKLQIGSVSVVRAESKDKNVDTINIPSADFKNQEINGALALFQQKYYSNTIIKLHKVISKYGDNDECGRMHFYIAKSFKEMDMDGQAVDSFQTAIDNYKEQKCQSSKYSGLIEEAEEEIKNLKN
jgi:hypothetical protein